MTCDICELERFYPYFFLALTPGRGKRGRKGQERHQPDVRLWAHFHLELPPWREERLEWQTPSRRQILSLRTCTLLRDSPLHMAQNNLAWQTVTKQNFSKWKLTQMMERNKEKADVQGSQGSLRSHSCCYSSEDCEDAGFWDHSIFLIFNFVNEPFYKYYFSGWFFQPDIPSLSCFYCLIIQPMGAA